VTIQVEIKNRFLPVAEQRLVKTMSGAPGKEELHPQKRKGTASKRRRIAGRNLFVVLDERKDVEAGELGAAI
jgi:hypothetical protein